MLTDIRRFNTAAQPKISLRLEEKNVGDEGVICVLNALHKVETRKIEEARGWSSGMMG